MEKSLDPASVLPHRYPFLLVDRLVEVTDSKCIGLKNVSYNEPFFQGHFPGYPVMPGVLILEAMAQVGAVALLTGDAVGKIGLLVGVDGARFRRQVVPGDQLRIEVMIVKRKGSMGKGHGTVYVGDTLAAEADILFAIADQP